MPATITTAAEARDAAIEWQASQAPMSWGEIADAQAYFEQLADRFPELRDEFEENGII